MHSTTKQYKTGKEMKYSAMQWKTRCPAVISFHEKIC